MTNQRAALYDVKLFFFNMARTNKQVTTCWTHGWLTATGPVENVDRKVDEFRKLCQNFLSLFTRSLRGCISNSSSFIIPVYALITVMQKKMHSIKSLLFYSNPNYGNMGPNNYVHVFISCVWSCILCTNVCGTYLVYQVTRNGRFSFTSFPPEGGEFTEELDCEMTKLVNAH